MLQANKIWWVITKENGGLTYNVYSYPENENLIGMNGKLNPNATLGRVVNGYMLYPDDWVDEAYSSALRQEYNVNIAGGTDKIMSAQRPAGQTWKAAGCSSVSKRWCRF